MAEILSTLWEVINKPHDVTVLSNFPPAESVPALPYSVSYRGAYSILQVRSPSHESRKLGSCEDRPHQVDPRRVFFRPEVLG